MKKAKIIFIISLLCFTATYSLLDNLDGKLGFITSTDVVTSSVANLTAEEIQKEILLGNGENIENNRQFNFKDIKISHLNYNLGEKKILGESLPLRLTRLYPYTGPKAYLLVENEATIDTLMNLDENSYLELTANNYTLDHDNRLNVYYTIKDAGNIVSPELYSRTPLLAIFSFISFFIGGVTLFILLLDFFKKDNDIYAESV